MRIQSNERRERLWSALQEATGERTKSGALDAAAEYYLKMHGSDAHPTGAVPALMEKAVDEGSVGPEEIAALLDTEELPISYEYTETWECGSVEE